MTGPGSARPKPIVHRVPSNTTIKQLYATAFGCCKPDCAEPLFRVNDATGEQLRNSTVAHVHARSEGGPRWNPSTTEEENSHYDNLLLLCEAHSTEIDATPEHYPAELLREWKETELAKFRQQQQNWMISDAQVDEITAASFALRPLLERIAQTIPFSVRMRTRDEALERAAVKASAKRSVRLGALIPPECLESVAAWMVDLHDPIVQVPDGQLRVLVGRMGAGKSEQALQWLEEALEAAQADERVEVPLWFAAREVIGGLESAIVAAIGGDPAGPLRVVVDDLDSISPKEADQLLVEAREIVKVLPRVAVLATSRPGMQLGDHELTRVEQWPTERGGSLLRAVIGDDVPWNLWSHETLELLRSPLTVLGVAARLRSGGDVRISRVKLLADLGRRSSNRDMPTRRPKRRGSILGVSRFVR